MKNRNAIMIAAALVMTMVFPWDAAAVKFKEIKVVDKDYIMIYLRDGEIRYRDNGTGENAFWGGYEYVDGDDTLVTFMPRLDGAKASDVELWSISSPDDKSFGTSHPLAVWRKSKPMHIAHDFEMELDHWLYLQSRSL